MFLYQPLVLRQQVCLAAQRLLQLPLPPNLLLALVHLGQALQAGMFSNGNSSRWQLLACTC